MKAMGISTQSISNVIVCYKPSIRLTFVDVCTCAKCQRMLLWERIEGLSCPERHSFCVHS